MFKHQKNIDQHRTMHYIYVYFAMAKENWRPKKKILFKSNEKETVYLYQTSCGDLGEGKVKRKETTNRAFGLKWNTSFNMSELFCLSKSKLSSVCKKDPTDEALGYSFHYFCYSALHWLVWKKNAIVSWNGCHWHEWCDARILSTMYSAVKMCVWYVNCINCFFSSKNGTQKNQWKWKARDLNSISLKVSASRCPVREHGQICMCMSVCVSDEHSLQSLHIKFIFSIRMKSRQ